MRTEPYCLRLERMMLARGSLFGRANCPWPGHSSPTLALKDIRKKSLRFCLQMMCQRRLTVAPNGPLNVRLLFLHILEPKFLDPALGENLYFARGVNRFKQVRNADGGAKRKLADPKRAIV